MINKPYVTVLMPVYNCELYVAEAIESILLQTYQNFEFLIIDDASNDTTVSIIKTFEDPRIHLIEKPKNSGYTESLNYGLSIAKGKYIARMDGDDISQSNRLERQVDYMEAHHDVVACGTSYRILDSDKTKSFPEHHEDNKLKLLEHTCFAHPTVMIRSSVLRDNNIQYKVEKEPAEDYDLWVRLLEYGKFYNLQDILLDYRIHKQQVSVTRRSKQLKSKVETRVNILRYLGVEIEASTAKVLEEIFLGHQLSFKEIKIFISIKLGLLKANNISLFFEFEAFVNYLNSIESQILKKYFLARKSFYPKLFREYLYFKKQGIYTLPFTREFVLLIKSILFYKKWH